MFTPVHRRLLAVFGVSILCAYLLGLVIPVMSAPILAAPLPQFTPFPTPTPRPDGRVIHIVEANDSWWRIAAIYNIDLNALLELNKASRDTILVQGEEVLLGLAGPAEVVPTAGPTATPQPARPTSSPQPGFGTLCVIVYDDLNGDSLRQENEQSIPGGAISVTDRRGSISLTETTASGLDPHCFEELPEGDYNVSVAVPDGFNPTTSLNTALAVEPGEETFLNFGAQVSSEALAGAPAPSGSGKSPLLGVLGGLILLCGLAPGIYASRFGKSKKVGE